VCQKAIYIGCALKEALSQNRTFKTNFKGFVQDLNEVQKQCSTNYQLVHHGETAIHHPLEMLRRAPLIDELDNQGNQIVAKRGIVWSDLGTCSRKR
jgi:hypothetical protein